MFGLLKSSCTLCKSVKNQWMSHICGVCLSLGNQFGQPARLATNYDAALISVLCEAQSPTPTARTNHICALRSFRHTNIVTTTNIGTQFASSIALKSAATKLEDHVKDKDGWPKHFPWLTTRLVKKWHTRSNNTLAAFHFNHQKISRQLEQQAILERQLGQDFTFYSEPTELAVAAVFANTAVITHTPVNQPCLFEMGRMYGRIMFLIDSYKDQVNDDLAGKFNALSQACHAEKVHTFAQQQFHEAHTAFVRQFNKLTLPQPNLATQLLVRQLAYIGINTFDTHKQATFCVANQQDNQKNKKHCCEECCNECCNNSICEICLSDLICQCCCDCSESSNCCDCCSCDCCCD